MPISVIIPLFNKGPYIERTLQSLLDQQRAPEEIIIVDDASEDDSLARVRVMHKRFGLATGDWVAYLDADDT